LSHSRRRRLPPTVFALGWVSFCTDLGSEMIVPLLPLLMTEIGASMSTFGLLRGASELAVSVLKLCSGWLSDRGRRRKPWIVGGYTLSALLRPLFALVQAPWQAVAVRAFDRVGKGLRSAPRDALLADVVPPKDRGAAYGVQRAMDHAGALCGALAACALLWLDVSARTVCALTVAPGLAAVLVLWLCVREPEDRPAAAPPTAAPPAPTDLRRLRPLLIVAALTAAAASMDMFALALAKELGVALWQLPLLWAVMHVASSTLSHPLGALSDRLGRRRVIAVGLLVQAAVLALFALLTAATAAWLWPAFLLFGLHAAFVEGAERGYVADLSGAGRRGTVFGVYYVVHGVASLVGALAIGWLWDARGASAAFAAGAGAALAALLALALFVPRAYLPERSSSTSRPIP
jgi:MFS family permease